jgi:hypothetical protein
MYEGEARTYYHGSPSGDGQFLVATFVTSLTAPDEAPYMTNQLRFDATDGFMDDGWFEDDFITTYARLGRPLALSRVGLLYDANSGSELAEIDHSLTTHFKAMDAKGGTLLIAGDNGRFWAGAPDALSYIENDVHRPMPGPISTLEEKIAWGQQMQQTFACRILAAQDFLIGGARGFLTRYVAGTFRPVAVGTGSHVTGISQLADGTILVCGHTPDSFVAVLNDADMLDAIYTQPGGPRLHSPCQFEDTVFVAASNVAGGLFTISDGALQPFDIPNSESFGALRHLEPDGSRLWAVFERALVLIKDGSFRVHQHPGGL